MKDITGILILHKEEGMTSQSATSRARHLFDAKKAGHTGTLDPMATGVLPILLGRATVAGEYMLETDKHYRAELTLGITTDTEDSTGTILSRHEGPLPDEAAVRAAAAGFLPEYDQIPPMYSALKRDGRKLCDLAREGITVEREPRRIRIYRLTVERLTSERYSLDVVCSKGTYIRTLCADLGRALGVGGVMSRLMRGEAAGFTLDRAHTLDELRAMSEEEREGVLLPVESLFLTHPTVCLPPFFARLAHAGAEIYQRKIGTDHPIGKRIRLYDDGGFFSLGEVREFPDGSAIKPIKKFR